MNAHDLQRLQLLVMAFDWHRREGDRSLAEYMEDLHRDHAERAGLPEPVEAYGDSFVVQQLAHAHALLGALCGATTCRAAGCSDLAPGHLGVCIHHDLEQALKLNTE